MTKQQNLSNNPAAQQEQEQPAKCCANCNARSEARYPLSRRRAQQASYRDGKWLFLLTCYAVVWKACPDACVKCHTGRKGCCVSYSLACDLNSHTGAPLCCCYFDQCAKTKVAKRRVFIAAVLSNHCAKKRGVVSMLMLAFSAKHPMSATQTL